MIFLYLRLILIAILSNIGQTVHMERNLSKRCHPYVSFALFGANGPEVACEVECVTMLQCIFYMYSSFYFP